MPLTYLLLECKRAELFLFPHIYPLAELIRRIGFHADSWECVMVIRVALITCHTISERSTPRFGPRGYWLWNSQQVFCKRGEKMCNFGRAIYICVNMLGGGWAWHYWWIFFGTWPTVSTLLPRIWIFFKTAPICILSFCFFFFWLVISSNFSVLSLWAHIRVGIQCLNSEKYQERGLGLHIPGATTVYSVVGVKSPQAGGRFLECF